MSSVPLGYTASRGINSWRVGELGVKNGGGEGEVGGEEVCRSRVVVDEKEAHSTLPAGAAAHARRNAHIRQQVISQFRLRCRCFGKFTE